MDLEKLKLLLDVVDTGAMSKAAVVRGVPQSFISRQVTALEREYGGRLFNRTGRGVSLSELGLLLTRAFAFVPVERRLRPLVRLFAPLRDKVTSSAQSVVPFRSDPAKDRARQS